MPTYTYFCDECKNIFELFYSFNDYIEQPNCEHCGCQNTRRSYSDDLANTCGFIKKSDSELKTVGDLANRNRDRMSNDQKQELYTKHNNYKDEPSQSALPQGMSRIKKKSIKNRWY